MYIILSRRCYPRAIAMRWKFNTRISVLSLEPLSPLSRAPYYGHPGSGRVLSCGPGTADGASGVHICTRRPTRRSRGPMPCRDDGAGTESCDISESHRLIPGRQSIKDCNRGPDLVQVGCVRTGLHRTRAGSVHRIGGSGPKRFTEVPPFVHAQDLETLETPNSLSTEYEYRQAYCKYSGLFTTEGPGTRAHAASTTYYRYYEVFDFGRPPPINAAQALQSCRLAS